MNKYIELALKQAQLGIESNKGGPFGAVIVKDDKVISVACNEVLSSNDPTAHAEIMAIRKACKILGTYDLSDCEIYATGEPCPMCMSAIIWANIKTCYYSNSVEDAAKIGFRDDFIYQHLRQEKSALNVIRLDPGKCTYIYDSYKKLNKKIY